MDPNEMTPTQYFVQKILNKQPIEPMDEVPLGPSLSDLLNTALGQRGISVAAAAELSGINTRRFFRLSGRRYRCTFGLRCGVQRTA